MGDKELRTIEISPVEERQQVTDHEFVRAILKGTTVSPDFEEGLRYVEFCEAVALSLQKQTTVGLPLAQPAMEHWEKSLAASAKKSALT